VADLHRRGFLIAGTAAFASLRLPELAEAAIAKRSGLSWASGGFDPNPDSFATWRGRKLDVLTLFAPRRTWTDISSSTGRWLAYRLRARPEHMVIGYPLFSNSPSPRTHGRDYWRRAAKGEFDAYHAAAARSLRPYGSEITYRVGWEWNNRTFSWTCTDVALSGYYKAYFRRVVQQLRANSPGCKIEWCCGRQGNANASIDRWYPGNDVVDLVGAMMYDSWPALTSQATWNSAFYLDHKGGPRGVGAWLEYAKSKGKPYACGEWGLWQKERNGGGDNPLFIQNMLELFRKNARHVGYESYFNVDTPTLKHRLQTYPKAGEVYRRMI
jgi:hypothetical protein